MRDRTGKQGWFSRKPILGLILVGLGVAFYLHNLHLLELDRLWRYGPLILLPLALERFINRGPLNPEGHQTLILVLALELWFLGFHSLLQRWWPLAVVWAGIVIVLRALFPDRRRALCQDSDERPL